MPDNIIEEQQIILLGLSCKFFKFLETKFDCLIRLKKNFSLYILSEFSGKVKLRPAL